MLPDPDKKGLPRVIDAVLVSNKNKSHIKALLGVVYKAAWEVRFNKERALDQQIPSSYIAALKVNLTLFSEEKIDRVGKFR